MNIIDIDLSTPTIIFEFETGITGPAGKQGPQGVQGVQGPQGEKGNDGLGVPPGGVKGAVLTKISSNDNDTIWEVLDRVKISSTKPINKEKLWIQKSKNLLNISSFKTKTLNGVTFTNNGNGSITINGTATDSFGVSFVAFVLKKGTYHLSLNANTLNSFYIYDYDTYESILIKEETTTLTKDYDNVGFDTWVVQGDVFNNITISPQLEVGDKATSFEAYVEKKIYIANENGVYEELINAEDTGWVLADLTDKFTAYSSGFDPMYRKQGKLVQIQGTIKPTELLNNGGNETIMFELPVGFRPKRWQYFVCHGSGSNRWLLGVGHTGTVTISRYGTTGFIDIPAGAWLPFNVSFMID